MAIVNIVFTIIFLGLIAAGVILQQMAAKHRKEQEDRDTLRMEEDEMDYQAKMEQESEDLHDYSDSLDAGDGYGEDE